MEDLQERLNRKKAGREAVCRQKALAESNPWRQRAERIVCE